MTYTRLGLFLCCLTLPIAARSTPVPTFTATSVNFNYVPANPGGMIVISGPNFTISGPASGLEFAADGIPLGGPNASGTAELLAPLGIFDTFDINGHSYQNPVIVGDPVLYGPPKLASVTLVSGLGLGRVGTYTWSEPASAGGHMTFCASDNKDCPNNALFRIEVPSIRGIATVSGFVFPPSSPGQPYSPGAPTSEHFYSFPISATPEPASAFLLLAGFGAAALIFKPATSGSPSAN